jgi:integrase
MTMTKVVRGMHKAQLAAGNAGFVDPQREGRTVTPHGFRSTFRDWVAETTSWPRELAETAIAHSVNSKTEASYQRGSMLEKRRELMNAWSNYCGDYNGEKVIALTALSKFRS